MTTHAVRGIALLLAAGATAQEPDPTPPEGPPPTITAHTAGMRAMRGFLDLHWDARRGQLWLEVPPSGEELLYAVSLATGLGSNPVGLDRGQLAGTEVVAFERVGPKVLLVARNTRFRADSDDAAERRAVAESFAPSVLWGFEVAAEEDGRALVDATAFFLRDARGVARQLRDNDQGTFALDASRSALHLPRTAAFPDNVEVEATLTFTSDQPGARVGETAAVAAAVTLRQHHSLIRLPDDGYRPRRHDPRVGTIHLRYADYGAPIDRPLVQRRILRHRLQKQDPQAARSAPVEPIVYHLDPGVPEPVRSALRDGAMWWAAAFEAAGFEDAFRVEDLPAGADPLDVRYHMIHWVHRSTRGWSYGGSIADPRTGEILKGNVLLGSLRVRQDHLIAHGLDPHGAGCAAAAAPDVGYLLSEADGDAAVQLALARLRQLAAHEVGHTLGLAHNFAASTYDDRASVMDYPAPRVAIDGAGALSFDGAYATGVGTYDVWAIRYAYTEFAPGVDEDAALRELVDGGTARFLHITDAHARAAGTPHPRAALWDNGADPVAALDHTIRVRAIGLAGLGLRHVASDQPLARLEETLVPLYLHHRYQLEAAAKSIGGVSFTYAVGPTGEPARPVDAATQRRALRAVLACLEPEFLAIPDHLRPLLPPHPPGYAGEVFDGHTGGTFDGIAMAATAADLVLDHLWHPRRAARLVVQNAADPALPGWPEVVGAVLERTWRAPPAPSAQLRALQRAARGVVVRHLLTLAADRGAAPDVAAVALTGLDEVDRLAAAPDPGDPLEAAHRAAVRRAVRHFRTHPDAPDPHRPPAPPPGSPIGTHPEKGWAR